MKLNLIKSLGLLAIAALITGGCSKTESGTQPAGQLPTLSGQEYGVTSGDIKTGVDRAEGTGTLLFRLPAPSDDNNYALTFELKEGGEVSLIANSSDAGLTTGIEFIMFRKNGKLEGRFPDGAVVTEDMPDLSATSSVTVFIDVHGHGDVIMVQGDSKFGFEVEARPKGRLWGLKLKDAVVTAASVGTPKAPH